MANIALKAIAVMRVGKCFVVATQVVFSGQSGASTYSKWSQSACPKANEFIILHVNVRLDLSFVHQFKCVRRKLLLDLGR